MNEPRPAEHAAARAASSAADRAAVAERGAVAYQALADLAETIEDEWQYVNDLVDAYLPAIRRLGGGTAPLPEDRAAAVDEAIAEIARITDPHRAIDWLSTFPHVVALAMDGDVDAAAEEPHGATTAEAAGGDDDDNPFAALLRGPDR